MFGFTQATSMRFMRHVTIQHITATSLKMDLSSLNLFQVKSYDENGNPVGSSFNYASRQLRPLSIYRHNPAFHSQHVSVNQVKGMAIS